MFSPPNSDRAVSFPAKRQLHPICTRPRIRKEVDFGEHKIGVALRFERGFCLRGSWHCAGGLAWKGKGLAAGVHNRHTTGYPANIADRVRSILSSRKLTLYQVSLRSATIFGHGSPYHLPHNFYYNLRRPGFSPSLHQLFALSRISNYNFLDWLRAFDFNVEAIPRLQIQFSSRRTILLDPSLDDPNSWIPWLRTLRSADSHSNIRPLSELFEWTKPVRLDLLEQIYGGGSIYAKIGEQDALAFPDLLPSSIVRVRPCKESETLPQEITTGKRLVLVEHTEGFCCCYVHEIANSRFAIISSQLLNTELAFDIPGEAKIVGAVDLEFRNIGRPRQPVVSTEFTSRWKPGSLRSEPRHFGALLRRARQRMGLSFRGASDISRQIADQLRDPRHFIAASSLSDYETVEAPPRHFHKLITLSAIYALPLRSILHTSGLHVEESGLDPIPDALMGTARNGLISSAELHARKQNGFLSELSRELEEIPFFLRGSADIICSLSRPSLKDCFWIDQQERDGHPFLQGAIILVVNRQQKKLHGCSKPYWQQPLHIVLKRDGNYIVGCCSRENNALIVHSYPGGVHRREILRHSDAEIIGKIVALVRKL